MVLTAVSGVALLVAVLAVVLVRRLARRVDAITRSYWDLRYEHTRLRSQVARLDPESSAPVEPAAPAPSVSFVPLSTIRKKDT